MRTQPVDYILTTYSATMFGDKASVHQRKLTHEQAIALLNDKTQIVATRPSHENMAMKLFGLRGVTRYADMTPDHSAILIHYRGVPINADGVIPDGSTVTFYLIESEEYLDVE